MDRRHLLNSACCGFAAILAGCFGDNDSDSNEDIDPAPNGVTPESNETKQPEEEPLEGWNQMRKDSRLSGASPDELQADIQLTKQWDIELSILEQFKLEHISPLRATANGQVYVTTVTRQDDPEGVDDSIRVITLARIVDGTLESRIHARVDPLLSGTGLSLVDLAVTDDTAVCSFRKNSLPTDGSLSGELVTFDLSTGETQYVEDRPGGGPITISGETIYVATVFEQGGFSTEDGTAGVAAIETQTGTVRWQNELAEFSFAGETYPPSSMRPAVYGGSVYASSPDGIQQFDPDRGTATVVTEHDGPCLIDGDRGLLYVVGENEITALDLTLGSASIAGSITVEGTLRGAAVSDGTLVVTTDGSIAALDVPAGQTLWRHTEEAITSLPSIAGDTVYYLGIDGLRCRSLSSGGGIRSSPVTLRDDADQLPESVSREPIVADGSVFVRSGNAVLAIEATDSS